MRYFFNMISLRILWQSAIFFTLLPACVPSLFFVKQPVFHTQSHAEVKTTMEAMNLQEEDVLVWPVDGTSPKNTLEDGLVETFRTELKKCQRFKQVLSLQDKESKKPLSAANFPAIVEFKNGRQNKAFNMATNLSQAKFQLVSALHVSKASDNRFLKMNLETELWDGTSQNLLWRGESHTIGTRNQNLVSRKEISEAMATNLLQHLGSNKSEDFKSEKELQKTLDKALRLNALSAQHHQVVQKTKDTLFVSALIATAAVGLHIMVFNMEWTGCSKTEAFGCTGTPAQAAVVWFVGIPTALVLPHWLTGTLIYHLWKNYTLTNQYAAIMNQG